MSLDPALYDIAVEVSKGFMRGWHANGISHCHANPERQPSTCSRYRLRRGTLDRFATVRSFGRKR